MKRPGWLTWGGIAFALLLMVLLRVIFLNSDPYANLTWSSELVTDEGFYCHDARDVILFGSSDLPGDNFHNALIMPLLHGLQVLVFRVVGVGIIQARLISVVLSLLTLALSFFACKRAFGLRTGLIATLLLGLDHTNLLYNRMALMDTPAQLPMVACFACFVCALKSEDAETDASTRKSKIENRKWFWWFACGLCLMAAYATRGLSALLIPIPLALCWFMPESHLAWKRAAWLLTGIVSGAAVYAILWYLPHRAELSRVGHFYLTQQLLPHSLSSVRESIGQALVGNGRSLAAYLFRHTPVQFILILLWFLTWRARQSQAATANMEQTAGEGTGSPQASTVVASLFLMGWTWIFLLTYATVHYAPPRYYVLFYPAMAMLTALALEDLSAMVSVWRRSILLRVTLGTFLAYHLAEAFLEHHNDALLYGLTGMAALILLVWRGTSPPAPLRFGEGSKKAGLFRETEAGKVPDHSKIVEARTTFLPSPLRRGAGGEVLLLLWCVVNVGWLAHWLTHLDYAQRDAERWLQGNLPANAVLIGDPAPGLSMRSGWRAISVLPGLANDTQPLEPFAGQPRYILVFEGRKPKSWWVHHYPQYVSEEKRLHRFTLYQKFIVDVYAGQ